MNASASEERLRKQNSNKFLISGTITLIVSLLLIIWLSFFSSQFFSTEFSNYTKIDNSNFVTSEFSIYINETFNWLVIWIFSFFIITFFILTFVFIYNSAICLQRNYNDKELKTLNFLHRPFSYFYYYSFFNKNSKFGESRNIEQKIVSNQKYNLNLKFNKSIRIISALSILIYVFIFIFTVFIFNHYYLNSAEQARSIKSVDDIPRTMKNLGIQELNGTYGLMLNYSSFTYSLSLLLLFFTGSFALVGLIQMIFQFGLINEDYIQKMIMGYFFGFIIIGVFQTYIYIEHNNKSFKLMPLYSK